MKKLSCLIMLCLSFFVTGLASAEQRIALVIANGAYQTSAGGALANPKNDGRIMAAALRDIGFDVTVVEDSSQKDMRRAILSHRAKLKAAGQGAVSFFYYAGHGATNSMDGAGGANYMIPVDARLQTKDDLYVEGVSLTDVVTSFADATMNFIVFDACRNFPFGSATSRSSYRGFVPVREKRGTLIAFSTSPGTVALDDSSYARYLSEELKTPGADHLDVFKNVQIRVDQLTQGQQYPWFSDGVRGRFIFRRGEKQPDFNRVTPQPKPQPTPDPELEFWTSVKDDCDGAKTYLQRYPNGRYVQLASFKLEQSDCQKDEDYSVLKPLNWKIDTDLKTYLEQPKFQTGAYSHFFELKRIFRNFSVQDLLNLADSGNAQAVLLAASLFNENRDHSFNFLKDLTLPESTETSKKYVERACQLGSRRACGDRSQIQLNESMMRKQSDLKSVNELRTNCDAGGVTSCAQYSNAIAFGFAGATKNITLATQYREKGCLMNDGTSCLLLALQFEQTSYGAVDLKKAQHFNEKACWLNNPLACHGLFRMWMSGKTGSKNVEKAGAFLSRACELGSTSSCMSLKYFEMRHSDQPVQAKNDFDAACRAFRKPYWMCDYVKQHSAQILDKVLLGSSN